MKIRRLRAASFHAEGRTHRRTDRYEESHNRF